MKLYTWRVRFAPYAAELGELFEEVGDHYTQRDRDRETKLSWKKAVAEFGIRGPDKPYIRKIFSDSLARRMGWIRGRMDANAERKLQRELETAGQSRIAGT